MADVVKPIHELQALDKDLHWFCPRNGLDDSSTYYDEDVATQKDTESEKEKEERHRLVAEAERRRKLVLHEAMQIFAFDGPEAAPYQTWMKEKLEWLMTGCDVCIRVYHRSRADVREALLGQYEDADQVSTFMKKLDELDIERICKGLDHATADLEELPPASRNIHELEPVGLYGLFEALSSQAFLNREDLLEKHFDRPFRLISTNKPLRLPSYNPALASFIFSDNDQRHEWAFFAFNKVKRPLLEADFDWCIKDALKSAMSRCVEKNYLPVFWNGVALIVSKMDRDVIRNCIYSMDPNICRLALDHLPFNHEGFADIVGTIQMLIDKGPNDFWDALGTMSPTSIIDQIFASPSLPSELRRANDHEQLERLFGWVHTLVASIKPVNLPPACRALLQQFTSGRMMDSAYPEATRFYSWEAGLKALKQTLQRLCEGRKPSTFVGRAICTDIFDVITPRLNHLMREIHTAREDNGESNAHTANWVHLTQDVIFHAIELDCLTLSVEREMVAQKKPLDHAIRLQSAPIWEHLLKSLKPGDVDIVSKALKGTLMLCGVGKFVSRSALKPEETQFNESFDKMSQFVCDLIEKASDFPQLNILFESESSCNSIMGALLSSHTATHQATVELFKTVSGADGRREALEWVLTKYYANFFNALSAHMSIITKKKVFDPTPRMLKVCSDVNGLLSGSAGIFRSRKLSTQEAQKTEIFWQRLWEALATIFTMTETFSVGRDKNMMMDYCRDTMEFAGKFFESYSVLASAIYDSEANDGESKDGRTDIGRRLLSHPKTAMSAIVTWLRLRDVFLIEVAVGLTKSVLYRLHEVSVDVESDTLTFIQDVISAKTRTKLSNNQLAELEEAVETHTGQSFKAVSDMSKKLMPSKQSRIDVSAWQNKSKGLKTEDGDDRKVALQLSGSAEEYKRKMAREKEREKDKSQMRKSLAGVAPSKPAPKPMIDVSEFRKQRMAEQAALKKQNAAAAAAARGKSGIGAQTNEAGSALAGLGAQGKVAAERGQGILVSSDSSEESEESDGSGDMDKELFGGPRTKHRRTNEVDEVTASVAKQMKAKMPVRKQRMVRSAKDMRARLAPNLDPLLTVILSWDFFHEGDYPPGSNPELYTKVPNKLRDVEQYRHVFLPLLTLEAWQSFVKSREESSTSRPIEFGIISRGLVDNFNEISALLMGKDVKIKDAGVMESDIVLLSKSRNPSAEPDAPHCLARVSRVLREKGQVKVMFKVEPGKNNKLLSHLNPQAQIYGSKIQSLTPLEREYGALQGLQYYDLAPEICDAVPSPILNYTDKQLESIMSVYKLNKAQAKAVRSAVDNDAFTLIQGPPGTGKTGTIVSLVGALLTQVLQNSNGNIIQQPRASTSQRGEAPPPPKKLLVCAPSNAAVDELVMRLKKGVKTTSGTQKSLNVVRLGRSDAINNAVIENTLDELVSKKLGAADGQKQNIREQVQKAMSTHQEVSAQLRDAFETLHAGKTRGEELQQLNETINSLKRQKQSLSNQIEDGRDKESKQTRNAELSRKRAQQEVLDSAHVICATLSGSGHDMFQSLNIEFETVIIDEAAQCVELSALIPLKYGCAKCILVGDPKQLPPTVLSKAAANFQYEQSLFVRMQTNRPNDVHLLDTQYRMHPFISTFPSQAFYDSRLLDGPDMAPQRRRPWHVNSMLGPYRFFDVQGQHQAAPKGHSLINIAEIKAAITIYTHLTRSYISESELRGRIGIITPYKSQLKQLKDTFSSQFGPSVLDTVDFNTTDAFQGREAEIIIFSCVRASPAGGIGFLQDIRRMNVGLTRAKSSLWVLGNSDSLSRGEFWKKLIDDAKARNLHSVGDVGSLVKRASKVNVEVDPAWAAHSSKMPDRTSQSPMEPPKGPKFAKTEDATSRRGSTSSNLDGEPAEKKNAYGKRGIKREDSDVEMQDAPELSRPKSTEIKKEPKEIKKEPSPPQKAPVKKEKGLEKKPTPPASSTTPNGNGPKTEGVPAPAPSNGAAAPPPKKQTLPPKKKKKVNAFMPPAKR